MFVQLFKSIPGLDGQEGKAGADVFVHFTGGGLAGITAASATYPLDLVRTRLAAQVKSFTIVTLLIYLFYTMFLNGCIAFSIQLSNYSFMVLLEEHNVLPWHLARIQYHLQR